MLDDIEIPCEAGFEKSAQLYFVRKPTATKCFIWKVAVQLLTKMTLTLTCSSFCVLQDRLHHPHVHRLRGDDDVNSQWVQALVVVGDHVTGSWANKLSLLLASDTSVRQNDLRWSGQFSKSMRQSSARHQHLTDQRDKSTHMATNIWHVRDTKRKIIFFVDLFVFFSSSSSLPLLNMRPFWTCRCVSPSALEINYFRTLLCQLLPMGIDSLETWATMQHKKGKKRKTGNR